MGLAMIVLTALMLLGPVIGAEYVETFYASADETSTSLGMRG